MYTNRSESSGSKARQPRDLAAQTIHTIARERPIAREPRWDRQHAWSAYVPGGLRIWPHPRFFANILETPQVFLAMHYRQRDEYPDSQTKETESDSLNQIRRHTSGH